MVGWVGGAELEARELEVRQLLVRPVCALLLLVVGGVEEWRRSRTGVRSGIGVEKGTRSIFQGSCRGAAAAGGAGMKAGTGSELAGVEPRSRQHLHAINVWCTGAQIAPAGMSRLCHVFALCL